MNDMKRILIRGTREEAIGSYRAGYFPCTECRDLGPHEDNGEVKLARVTFACRECGVHMDLEELLGDAGLL